IENVAALRHGEVLIKDFTAADFFENLPRSFGIRESILAGLQFGPRPDGANRQENPISADDAFTRQFSRNVARRHAVANVDENRFLKAPVGSKPTVSNGGRA